MKLNKILKKSGYEPVKLKTLQSGHHLIDAEINGVKGKFILDTGASNTVVDENQAQKFGISLKTTKHKATGAGTAEIDIKKTKKLTLQIGKWKLKKVNLISMDLEHINTALQIFDIKIDGIIGADVLHTGKGIIQYNRDLLFLKSHNKVTKNKKKLNEKGK